MTMPILLIGKNGQVGRELDVMLPRLGDVTSLGREQLDLAKPDEIRKLIRAAHPKLIVNAAAYTAVDRAESEEALARAVNADAPATIAEEAKKIGAALVHYSTDYVFDGSKRAPYNEEDAPNPQNAYGRTKLAGEEAIRQSGVPHLIFRTAWVYARQGRNFLLTILRLATQREELRIVSDQIGAPTWSHAIAGATTDVLAELLAGKGDAGSLSRVSGTYHMTAAGETSWFHFAEAILKEAQNYKANAKWFHEATGSNPLIVKRILTISTLEYPTPVRRPAYAVLSNQRLLEVFGIQLPDWRTQLRAVFAQPAT